MIKTERTAHGVECKADGTTFDILAETMAVVEAAAQAVQNSTEGHTTFETALQDTIGIIYGAICKNRGINHEKA